MIPLKDNIPTRQFPVVSVAIIVANVVVFLADQATGHVELVRAITPDGYPVQARHFEGGLSAQYALIPAQLSANLSAAWVTLFTHMFLHANWLHIGGNMLSMWIFGNNVEDTLGKGRFIVFYLMCGLAAAAAQIAASPGSEVPMVGASGAIAGMMGAYLILFPNAQILTLVPWGFFSSLMEIPALIVVGLWALLQFFSAQWMGGGSGGGVAYFAHVGGFAAGVVMILALGGRRLTEDRRQYPIDEKYLRG
jgi:membrane associated rhomboid family serine protease